MRSQPGAPAGGEPGWPGESGVAPAACSPVTSATGSAFYPPPCVSFVVSGCGHSLICRQRSEKARSLPGGPPSSQDRNAH